MTYADVPAGSTVFLDANVFIHHFEPNAAYGAASTEFLERVEHQQVDGVTSTHILSEVAHRLMTIEAMQAFGWKSAGIALRLRNHPAQVPTLKHFRRALQEIPRLRSPNPHHRPGPVGFCRGGHPADRPLAQRRAHRGRHARPRTDQPRERRPRLRSRGGDHAVRSGLIPA